MKLGILHNQGGTEGFDIGSIFVPIFSLSVATRTETFISESSNGLLPLHTLSHMVPQGSRVMASRLYFW